MKTVLFNKFLPFFLTLLVSSSLCQAYTRPSHVDPLIWNSLTPYFLPETHPIKFKLDKLFSKKRIIKNSKTLKAADFKKPKPRPFSHTVVSKHPKLKGFWIKMYTDEQTDINDWVELKNRILGAQYARESIERHHYEHLLKVPGKWIYPLPASPAPPAGGKNFILVAEDAGTLKKKASYARWLRISPEHLKAVHTVLQEAGLYDSALAFNIPFTKDGRIAFIDTQQFHKWPVPFHKLNKYLAPSTREKWKAMTGTP